MITTAAPAWLRRSDQAVTWARTMLQPRRAVVIDCETTDLPGGVCEVAVVDTTGRVLLNCLVNPGRPISPEAQRVHNISDRMVPALQASPRFSRRSSVSRPAGGSWRITRRLTGNAYWRTRNDTAEIPSTSTIPTRGVASCGQGQHGSAHRTTSIRSVLRTEPSAMQSRL